MFIRLLFVLPIIMCLIWWLYLRQNGWTIKQGIKGFAYILGFNAVVLGFFMTMIVVTH